MEIVDDHSGSESDSDGGRSSGSQVSAEEDEEVIAPDSPEYNRPTFMPEFSPSDDLLVIDRSHQPMDSAGLCTFELLLADAEKRYFKDRRIESVEDDDVFGYGQEIVSTLTILSHFLRARRRRRYIKEFASRFHWSLPLFVEEEHERCSQILGQESPELSFLISQEKVQLKTTSELDVAVFLTEFNKDPKELCLFCFGRRNILKKFKSMALGRFRATFKEGGVWTDEVVYDVVGPAFPPPPAGQQILI